MSADRYCVLGPVPGTPHTRYGILHGDSTIYSTQISRPDGIEVPRPATLRWRRAPLPDVRIHRFRINETPLSAVPGPPARGKNGNGDAPAAAPPRTLMPHATDESLAAARERGSAHLAASNAARRFRKAAA